MKLIFFFIFLLITFCANPLSRTERIYICGDHACKNEKEKKDYFNNNISIEVYTIEKSNLNKESFDLVELNLLEDKLMSKQLIKSSEKKKIIQEKVKERKKLAKLKIEKLEEPKEKLKAKSKKTPKKKKNKQFTFIRICKNLEECDIDKISKIMMDIGKQKPYPDLTNN
tara:strand:+ start:6023 stop:6529 length:507 start_codon:yes stop_codon:yes gene_type:complete